MDAPIRRAVAARRVIPPDRARLALALPVRSSPGMAAAARIVIFLLRTIGSAQLHLLPVPPQPTERRLPGGPGMILLVACNVEMPALDTAAKDRLERVVRAQVERQYAREGIMPVAYDLQIL